MGITLREIIFDIGGGIRDGKKFKAVQIGGPSGGCLTESQLDSKMDFDSLTKIGAMIGSGGLVVMDENTCMVEVARFFMNFTQREVVENVYHAVRERNVCWRFWSVSLPEKEEKVTSKSWKS